MTKETAYPSTISCGCVDHKTSVLAHATFDGNAETAPKPGDLVPPLWHWFAFPPDARTEDLNTDGHPAYHDY
jgi:3-methylfumaryl-CoA hydratase